jgi:CRISPR-associated protein Csm5
MSTIPEIALTKPDYGCETKRIRLTSRALHIGSEAQKLSPFEYVATDKFVYLPDTDALAKALQAKGDRYLKEYINRIEQRQKITPLLKEALGDNWHQATSPDGRIVFPKQRRSLLQTDQNITDLRPMIRNGFGQIYIPGSSIKGAIRTAIAYHLIKYADKYTVPQERSAIEEKIRENMGEIRSRPKFADDKLFMDQLFSNFLLEGDRTNANLSPNTDFMRAVHVTDSKPLIEEKRTNKQGKSIFINLPVTSEVMLISHFEDWTAKYKSPLYIELVRTVKAGFEIVLDTELLKKFQPQMQVPFQSIDDILNICQEFAQDQWLYEQNHWLDKMKSNPNGRDDKGQPINLSISRIQEFYQVEGCPYSLRLGWASGSLGTTVGLMFSDELRQELRAALYPRNSTPNFEAPKSRRVVTNCDRQITSALGWVKFEVLP